MSTFPRVNGWLIDNHTTAVWVRDPDHRVAAIVEDEPTAIEWAKSHNDHVKAGCHSRGHSGCKMKRYERRL